MTDKKKKVAKVLITEDEKFILDIYFKKFENSGFSVDTAVDGEEAWKKINENLPDVLLLDISMPKINGLELLDKIKKESKFSNLIIIILTNFGEREYTEKAIEKGADDFFVKANLYPNEIVEIVEEKLQKTDFYLSKK